MSVSFDVRGETYSVPEPQAAILAENLRILAGSELSELTPPAAELGLHDDWRSGSLELANSIEHALVVDTPGSLELAGGGAAAAYCVLRLMVGMDSSAAAGLRDALGSPVAAAAAPSAAAPAGRARQLTRNELVELLLVLFVLAFLTVIAGTAWTGIWYVLAPVIAGLLGLRIATTRASGRLAWSVATIVWWGVLLVPAAVLAVLVGLLVAALL